MLAGIFGIVYVLVWFAVIVGIVRADGPTWYYGFPDFLMTLLVSILAGAVWPIFLPLYALYRLIEWRNMRGYW